MIDVLSAFGLAAATGLNAYLPLLIVGLMARYTDLVTLRPPFDALENPWVLGVLAVLLAIEMTADKIPAVDSVNDVIQTVVRPAAGAIIFAASANVITEIHPVVAIICGLLAAFSVHAVKATGRPLITATTAGVGNPIVSTAEDVAAGVTTLVAILVPALAATLIVALVAFLAWRLLRRRQRRLVAQA
jgi:glucan phosphoethanolaminetransferase (alkaline phosphatase superfamily)